MQYNPLGHTGLNVSRLSFGASALGGVFRPVDEAQAIRAVHAALDLGINYFDNDTRLLELLPIALHKGIGIVNGSPFGSGLLTDRGPADWHPADAADRAVFASAADYCRQHGTSISQLALQFSSQNPAIPTTLFSSASAESVQRNVAWHAEPVAAELLAEVQKLLQPVMNKQWNF